MITQHDWYKKMRQALKTISIKKFLLELIHNSHNAFKHTIWKETYMIWHDRLSILWDKETQDWLSSLKCGIEGWPDRTWTDRFICLHGQYNKSISAYYKNSLPGDSPELMPLDCHLFSDIKEGVSRNMAFTFFFLKMIQQNTLLQHQRKPFWQSNVPLQPGVLRRNVFVKTWEKFHKHWIALLLPMVLTLKTMTEKVLEKRQKWS